MSTGIDAEQVTEDLMVANEIAEMYTYGTDEDGDVVMIQHYDEEGNVLGHQTVMITVGDFKPVAA